LPSTPQQLRTRARFEALIGLGAPLFDLVLAVGERVSRVAGRNDAYVPIRAGDRLELEAAARRRPRPGSD
jgi:hypothetical protein